MAAVLYPCSDNAPLASGARYKVADKWPFSPANVKRLQRGLCVALPPKRDTAELAGLRDRLQSVGRLADDFDVLLRVKDHAEAVAHERLVIT